MKQFFLGAMFAFVLAAPVAAQNLVVDGGFEDGLNGWTQVGNYTTDFNYVTCPGDISCAMQAGNYPSQGLAGVSQHLATGAGGQYQITLDWMDTSSNDSNGQEFDILWNGGLVGQIKGEDFLGVYTPLSFSVTGIGNDLLSILGISNSGYNRFDNVSVVETVAPPPGSGAVPEPASWALMLGGFGLIGGVLRTRRSLAFA